MSEPNDGVVVSKGTEGDGTVAGAAGNDEITAVAAAPAEVVKEAPAEVVEEAPAEVVEEAPAGGA